MTDDEIIEITMRALYEYSSPDFFPLLFDSQILEPNNISIDTHRRAEIFSRIVKEGLATSRSDYHIENGLLITEYGRSIIYKHKSYLAFKKAIRWKIVFTNAYNTSTTIGKHVKEIVIVLLSIATFWLGYNGVSQEDKINTLINGVENSNLKADSLGAEILKIKDYLKIDSVVKPSPN